MRTVRFRESGDANEIEDLAVPLHLGVVAGGMTLSSAADESMPALPITRQIAGSSEPRRQMPMPAVPIASRGERLVVRGDRVEIPREVIGGVAIGPRGVRIERRRIEVQRLLVRLSHGTT